MWNSSNSSNVVWNVDYSTTNNSSYTTITTSSSNSVQVQFSFMMKRCRNCKHSHAPEGAGCYDVVNYGMTVAYAVCSCKEHVPEDNLEFLEYMSRKKESI